MSNQKGLNVYDTAKVGCNYAQPKTGNQKLWNVRRVKIDHNLGDEQCGGLAVHNHNCLTGKEREALKFDRCYSDYYYTAISHLRALYPANKEYQLAFEAAYKKQFADRKDLAPYPPCIFAVLDTWFEYSDIEISDKYSRLQGAISGFKIKLNSAAKGLKDWAADEIKARRKALDIKRANAQWSNVSQKVDNAEEVYDTINKNTNGSVNP